MEFHVFWTLCPTGFEKLFAALLKIKICLQQSFDHYSPYPGSQASFYGSHKITVLIWPVCFSKGLSALDVRKKIQKSNFCLSYLFSGFTDKFFIIKLLRWDSCFSVTLAPWRSINHLYPVLYCYQTVMWL